MSAPVLPDIYVTDTCALDPRLGGLMSIDPTKIRSSDPPRHLEDFEHAGLRFKLASGISLVSDGTPGYLFHVHAVDGSLLGKVSGILATDSNSVSEIGHIGVEVVPERRGEGLPSRFALGVVPLLREEGVTDILFTCDPANNAIKAAIGSVGAEYLDEWPGNGQDGVGKSRFALRDTHR